MAYQRSPYQVSEMAARTAYAIGQSGASHHDQTTQPTTTPVERELTRLASALDARPSTDSKVENAPEEVTRGQLCGEIRGQTVRIESMNRMLSTMTASLTL